jgi:Leucine-rich repeat (LRR) protein
MNSFYIGRLLALIGACLAGACSYSVSVNDNVVYTPAPLFTDYQIADDNLRRCVEQTITDEKITGASQLTLLNCSNAGIASLAGLERFGALQELNLAENQLRTLAPLVKLTQLKVLVLRKNQLDDVAPLLGLLKLVQVDLEQNPQLECTDVNQLAENMRETGAEILKPEQCR